MDQPKLIGLIADEETCTGFLLAGIGESTSNLDSNFLAVGNEITDSDIENFFEKLYARKDIAMILIGKEIANRIKDTLKQATRVLPIIVELPSKYELTVDEDNDIEAIENHYDIYNKY